MAADDEINKNSLPNFEMEFRSCKHGPQWVDFIVDPAALFKGTGEPFTLYEVSGAIVHRKYVKRPTDFQVGSEVRIGLVQVTGLFSQIFDVPKKITEFPDLLVSGFLIQLFRHMHIRGRVPRRVKAFQASLDKVFSKITPATGPTDAQRKSLLNSLEDLLGFLKSVDPMYYAHEFVLEFVKVTIEAVKNLPAFEKQSNESASVPALNKKNKICS